MLSVSCKLLGKSERRFIAGLMLLVVNGCAFKESSPSEVRGQNSASAFLSTLSLQAIYSETLSETRKLVPSANGESYFLDHSLVLPVPVPKEIRFKLRLPAITEIGLTVKVTTTYNGQIRELHSSLQNTELDQSDLTTEVTIQDIGALTSENRNSSAVLTLLLTSEKERRLINLSVRTPPIALSPKLNATKSTAISLSRNASAVALNEYIVENNEDFEYVLRIPYRVRGQLFREFASIVARQIDRCNGQVTAQTFRSMTSNRLLLAPSGLPNQQLLRLASDPSEPIFELRLSPGSKQVITLFAITAPKHADATSTKECWRGQTQQISFGCHQGNCVEKHCEATGGHEGIDVDLSTTGQFCSCVKYAWDPNSPQSANSRINLHGHGYEIEDPFRNAVALYGDIPFESPHQSGGFAAVATQYAVSGNVDFASALGQEPESCIGEN